MYSKIEGIYQYSPNPAEMEDWNAWTHVGLGYEILLAAKIIPK